MNHGVYCHTRYVTTFSEEQQREFFALSRDPSGLSPVASSGASGGCSSPQTSSVDPNVLPALIAIVAHVGEADRYGEFYQAFRAASTPQEEQRYLMRSRASAPGRSWSRPWPRRSAERSEPRTPRSWRARC